jgi:hypothetical protein
MNKEIIVTFVPVVGKPFTMSWGEDSEEEVLEYCNSQIKHWGMDSIHIEGLYEGLDFSIEKNKE